MTDRAAARRALIDTVGKVIDYLQGGRKATGGGGIDDMVQGYIDDLTRDLNKVIDRELGAPTAEQSHLNSLDDLANRAYDAGMTDGGADPDERDDADNASVSDWTTEQGNHVAGLWDDVKQLRKDQADLSKDEFAARFLALNDRIGQWGASLRNLYSLGKASAQKNMSGTWKLGATEQHCDTCAKLDGQRHRLKWFLDKGYIPQENGSQTLTCGGWRCDCTIEADDGTVLLP